MTERMLSILPKVNGFLSLMQVNADHTTLFYVLVRLFYILVPLLTHDSEKMLLLTKYIVCSAEWECTFDSYSLPIWHGYSQSLFNDLCKLQHQIFSLTCRLYDSLLYPCILVYLQMLLQHVEQFAGEEETDPPYVNFVTGASACEQVNLILTVTYNLNVVSWNMLNQSINQWNIKESINYWNILLWMNESMDTLGK